MIVFWKLIFKEDIYLFGGYDYDYKKEYNNSNPDEYKDDDTVYPDYDDYKDNDVVDPSYDDYKDNGALYPRYADYKDNDVLYPGYDYLLTNSDEAINYIAATLFLAAFLVSTLLNPLLFYYYGLTKSKASRLFMLLAAADFVTNLITPMVYSVMMYSSKLYPSSSSILLHVRPISCIFGCFSQFFTAVLAVTRLCKITMPFIHLSQRYIFGYLAVHVIYMLGANGTYYAIDVFWSKEDASEMGLMSVLTMAQAFCFWSYFLHCIAGVVASVVTVVYLMVERRSNPATAEKYLGSCITLLLINLPYVITITLIAGLQWAPWTFNTREIIFAWVPILTSALDPIIVLARKEGIKEKIISSCFTGSKTGPVTSSSTGQNTRVHYDKAQGAVATVPV